MILHWLAPAALVVSIGGCSRTSQGGDAERQTSSVASASSSVRPRKPELPEVATAKYYAAFESIGWARAEKLMLPCHPMWIEESQAGRAYLTIMAEGQPDEQYVTEVPIGVDLDERAKKANQRPGCKNRVKHLRYEQISWSRALQLFRGEVSGQKVTAVMAAHHDRVFINTEQGDSLLAIESSDNAMAEFVEQVGLENLEFSFVVE